jgi:Spy/CpxP family protein refolding chaperone
MTFSISKLSTFTPSRLVAVTLLTAVLGGAALSVMAQPMGHRGQGMHEGGPGMGMMMGGRGVERMLDSVNATADQRGQVKAIADRAMTDMTSQREAGRGLREQMMKLFAQPVVDANAVEALRAQMLQQHDQASRRMTQAMVEVSRVLTPEQRKQLADNMGKRREMMQRHQHERQQLGGNKPAAG